METSYYSTMKNNKIIAGETVYHLNFNSDRFTLRREYMGRGKDTEWTGTYVNNCFNFDQIANEEILLYKNPDNSDEYYVKGKAGCLGNSKKEMKFYKS